MDYFTRQDQARRNTRWLIFLFVIAVVGIVIAVDMVVMLVLASGTPSSSGLMPTQGLLSANAGLLFATSALTSGFIGVASLYKVSSLRSGGGKVARDLGGTRVTADASDPAWRRLLNVVEEMAIASGLPVPEVYVLEDEPGINAFAAGSTPSDAAVAVTSGCLEQLSRDELQGVIGHEFSHILNGDMRLNIRLMGLLFGIVVIGLIGRILLRGSRGARFSGLQGRRNGKGAGGIVVLGLGLTVIGYIGVLCARLIRAAVSRQREFLADASAVQFSRNPAGLAGAL